MSPSSGIVQKSMKTDIMRSRVTVVFRCLIYFNGRSSSSSANFFPMWKRSQIEPKAERCVCLVLNTIVFYAKAPKIHCANIIQMTQSEIVFISVYQSCTNPSTSHMNFEYSLTIAGLSVFQFWL